MTKSTCYLSSSFDLLSHYYFHYLGSFILHLFLNLNVSFYLHSFFFFFLSNILVHKSSTLLPHCMSWRFAVHKSMLSQESSGHLCWSFFFFFSKTMYITNLPLNSCVLTINQSKIVHTTHSHKYTINKSWNDRPLSIFVELQSWVYYPCEFCIGKEDYKLFQIYHAPQIIYDIFRTNRWINKVIQNIKTSATLKKKKKNISLRFQSTYICINIAKCMKKLYTK